MIRTAAALALTAGLLAACNNTTGHGHQAKKLNHWTVELFIEQQLSVDHVTCNHGQDMPMTRKGQQYTCRTDNGHTYTVVITNPRTGSYTIR